MIQSLTLHKKYLTVFSVLYLLLAVYYLAHPQEVLTYYHNSEITYFKAQDMARGNHQWGMFFDGPNNRTPRYEFHMPEGPTYVMAAWMKLGLPISAYRVVPILSSWLAHLIFLLALLYQFGKHIESDKIVLAFIWVALQPMVVAWSKAVDDGSFNMSLMVLMASCALFQWKGRWWGYLILGFLLGCQEFYRQPMMILFLWFVEFILALRQNSSTIKSLSLGFLWATMAGIGVLLGLLVHIGQLALVWGSWNDAWNEMAGAALGRASIQNDLNPAFFHEKLKDQIGAGAPLEWVRLKTMCKIFVSVFWYDQGRQYIWPVVFVAGAVWFWWKNKFEKISSFSWSFCQKLLIAGFLFLIPNIWTLMMPNHASVHFYYIARDYTGFFWAVLILWCVTKSHQTVK
jgi:hypothetical protein